MGEDTEGMVESSAKLRDLIKGMTGFDIMEDEQTFKSIYEIIVGIGEKWKDLSDIQQASLLEKLAGKTQANTLASALNNIDTLKEAYNSAEESAGSAMQEQAHFEEGIQYSINQFNASVEALSHTLLDSGVLKFFVDLGTTGVEALDKLTQKMSSIPAIITGIVTAMSFAKGENFFTKPVEAVLGYTSNVSKLTKSRGYNNRSEFAKGFVGNFLSGKGSVPAEMTNANSILEHLQKNGVDLSLYEPTIEELQQISQQLGIVGDEAAQAAHEMIQVGVAGSKAGQQAQKPFKDIGKLLKNIGETALSIGTTMLVSFALTQGIKAIDAYINRYKDGMRELRDSKSNIDNAQKELASLRGEYDTIQHRIDAINKIGGAKLVKDGEKEKLEAQSKELERQIALKEASIRADVRSAYEASKKAGKGNVESHDNIDIQALQAGMTREEYLRKHSNMYGGDKTRNKTSVDKAIDNEIKWYDALIEKQKEYQEQVDNLTHDEQGKYSRDLAIANGDELEEARKKLNEYKESADEARSSVLGWYADVKDRADVLQMYEDYGYQLSEADKATIKLADDTKAQIDAMDEASDGADNASNSQGTFKNSVIKTTEQLQAQKTQVDSLVSSYKEIFELASRGDGLDVQLDSGQLIKYGAALEYVNGNYKLNIEKLFELAEARNQDEIAIIKQEKEMANMDYLKNIRDIETYNRLLKEGQTTLSDGTSIKKHIADLQDQNKALIQQNQIADYNISQLENVTSAYQKWLAVSGQETDAKAFTGVQDASKSILDLLEKGKIGLDSYKMAVDFVIPEDISSQGEVAIQKYVKNLQKYFTEDRTGIDKFLTESSFFTETSDGYELKEGTSVNDIAKDMGWTVEVTRAMIDQLETFGGEFKWDIEGMFSDTDKLVHYQEELAKINEEKDKFNLNELSEADSERLDELNVQADALGKKIDEVQGKINKTTFDKINKSAEEHAGVDEIYYGFQQLKTFADQNDISNYVQEKLGISNRQEVQIYTDEAQKNVEALTKRLEELDAASPSVKDTEQYEQEYQKVTDDLKEQGIMLEMLNEVLLEDNGVSTEETVSQIASILETISTAVGTIASKEPEQNPNGDTDSGKGKTGGFATRVYGNDMGEVPEGLEDKTVTYTLSVDSKEAEEGMENVTSSAKEAEGPWTVRVQESGAGMVKATLDSISRLMSALTSKEYVIKSRYETIGNPPTPPSTGGGGAKGNVFANGNAFARGNDIVGEQGRELVVDPNRGIWYTVGDSGTEMIDLPKDAIIYSHNQTEALLKSGVTTRGKSKGRSFAEGTKYAPTPEEMKKYIWGNIDLQHRQPYFYTDEDGWDHVNTVLGAHKFSRGLHFALAGLAQGDEVYQIDDGALQWYADQLTAQSLDPDTILGLDKQGFTDDAGNWLHDLVAYVGTNAEEAERISQIMHVISDEYERSIGTYARGNAFANGTLVGERGRELVVDPNSGRWYTVGDYGSEMVNLPKDAIVYNHQQTEDLLKNGHTGRGHSTGASFAEGNAYAASSGRNDGSSKPSGKVPKAPKTYTGGSKSAEKSAKAAADAAKSAEKAAKGAKDATDEAKNNMIWIDRAIERQERNVSKINDLVEDDYLSYTERLSDLSELREELSLQNEILTDALERRVEEFDKAFQELVEVFGEDVATDLLHKIEVGSVDKDTYKDEFGEDEAGEKKKKALDKVIDAYDEEVKLSDKLKDNEDAIRDAIQKEYEFRLNILEAEKDQLQFEMDTLEHNLDMKDVLGKMVVEGDYQDMIDQSEEIADNIQRTIDVLEEQLTTVDEGSAKYNEINSQLISAKKKLQDIEKNQAEWNDKIMRLPIERLDKYIGMLENIKKDLQNWISERDTLNIETLGQTMSAQFSNLKDIAKAYQDQEQKWFKLRANYEWGSDKYEEATNEMQNCQDSISSIVQEMEELTAQFLKLPIDKISKINDKLQNINSAEQRVLDDYDTALSAVLSKFDQLIDKRNDEIDILNKRYDEMIKPYQDQLDLLNEQNEAKQMQYNIDKAQYDLDKARQQKNVQVVRNGRIEYESDIDALKSAQDNLNNAQHDKDVYDLQQKIDALEKRRDAEIEPLEKEIEKLEDARNRWQTFEDERTFEKEAAEAVRLLGANWEKAIEGTITNPHSDDREYNIFSKGHIELDRQITANEKQMEMNEKMMDLMTRYSDAYMSGEMTLDELKSQYAKLYADYQSGGGLVSQEALAAELAFNKAKDMADALAKNNIATTEQYKLFGDTKRLDEIGSYTETYKGLQKTWDQMAADIKAQTEELKRLYELAEQIAGQRRSSGGSRRGGGDSDGGGGEWSKNPTGYGAGTKYNPYGKGTLYEGDAVFTGKSIYIDNSGGDATVTGTSNSNAAFDSLVEFYSGSHSSSGGGGGGSSRDVSIKASGDVKVESKSTEVKSSSKPSGPASDPSYTSRGKGPHAFADGLAKGMVGGLNPSEKFKKLQAMGLKPLEPDEVPAFLHVGEGVVNAIQQSNILKSVGNAFKAGVASIPTDAVKSVENNYTFDCQFGDFILPNVQDSNGFASAMKNNFESIMNQQFSKIF